MFKDYGKKEKESQKHPKMPNRDDSRSKGKHEKDMGYRHERKERS